MPELNVSLPLSHRLTEAQLDEVGEYIGSLLEPAFKRGNQNAICKWLYDNGALEFIEGYSIYLSRHSKEIMDSELLLAWFRRNSVFCDVMHRAIAKLHDLDIVLIGEYSGKDIPGMYEFAFEDLGVIGLWIVQHGGTSEDIRRMVDNRTAKYLRVLEKKHGLRGMLTILWRACTWYSMLAQKVYNPRLKEIQTARIRAEKKKAQEVQDLCDNSFNSMASAFSKLKRK